MKVTNVRDPRALRLTVEADSRERGREALRRTLGRGPVRHFWPLPRALTCTYRLVHRVEVGGAVTRANVRAASSCMPGSTCDDVDVDVSHRNSARSIPAVPRTDRASRVIAAPVGRVFDALVDHDALLVWLPPRGMTARFERFDPTPGGSYRLVLTYADPAGSRGKSSADSDIVETRYVDIVPNTRVVQAVDFVSDDPQFAGTMTMTWDVSAVGGGTRVDVTADDVPDGISAEDHSTGMASSLENLAAYVES
jgi:uncharacterized protein YndB with AHSA1/START domain